MPWWLVNESKVKRAKQTLETYLKDSTIHLVKLLCTIAPKSIQLTNTGEKNKEIPELKPSG